MATVYLATDAKLHRQVAIKLLHPSVVATLGPERFLREITIASHLNHPHILAIHDSGTADGRLFYVMPYVEGESLRQLLLRERQLGIAETITIVAAVAAALDCAHRAGVIHRDIKPENILLARDPARGHPHPLLADFGIARALNSVGDQRLTESGLVLGTPAYMSPEQSAADGHLDARSDLYSLGCVAYEMLAGQPPFTGPTAQAISARHAVDPVPPLRTVRPTVPEGVVHAIERALAKVPADRFATAGEFASALQVEQVSSVPRRRGHRWLSSGSVLVGVLVAGVLLWRVQQHGAATPTVNDQVVAVVPFRVSGTDTSLRYLREGMLDLLSTKLSGTENLRTVDPRTMLSAWRRAGGTSEKDLDRTRDLALATELGAGRVLEGEVTGTPNHIILSAVISPAAAGKEISSSVEGPPDSLAWLVDELAAQLLALGAGEPKARVSTLTSTSLPALRAYLAGRAALRHGTYPEAVRHFDEALELDSTFALAGLGRTQGAIWIGEAYEGPGSRLAWRYRDRLAPRDRAVLTFFLGPDWPNLSSSSFRGALSQAEAMVAAFPDNPEALAAYADYLYHYGNLVGIPDAVPRSLRVYRRALGFDSSYTPTWEHLGELYFRIGDTAAASQAIRFRLTQDSVSPAAARDRWFAGRILGDSSVGPQALTDSRLVDHPGEVLRLTIAFGGPFSDADSLLERALASAQGEQDRTRHQRWARWYYLARGWPQRALQVTTVDDDWDVTAQLIRDALICDGDSALAARLARQVVRNFRRPASHETMARIEAQYAAAQFQLINGDPGPAGEAVRRWLIAPFRPDSAYIIAQVAAQLLDAQLAGRDRRPDARARLERLDSLIQTGVTPDLFLELIGNIEVARMWYEQGEPARALRAIRRRSVGYEASSLPRYLRDEGRYAALAADPAGAIRAYRHYLLLRSEAEPSLQPEVAAVRAELDALEKTPVPE